VDFDVTDQLLITYSGTVYRIYIDFEKANDSVRREVLHLVYL
jgi:hypothetical protein